MRCDDVLREIFQLAGLSYLGKDGRFRMFYATDIIKGSIISANTDNSLEDLIFPYSKDELYNALEKSRKTRILDSKNIEIKPCDKKMYLSQEFEGTVESMSHRNAIEHEVTVRDVFDPRKVEFSCKCDKNFKIRHLRGIWSPILLREWDLDENEKFYSYSICPHLCAFKNKLEKTSNVNCFGIDLPKYMKPYVLSYINVLEAEPQISEYVLDFAYLQSSMFDDAIKQINGMRKSDGLGDLDISTQIDVGRYLIDNRGFKPERIDRVIDIVAY